MIKKLEFEFHKTGNFIDKVIVAIHGWQGNRYSMQSIIKSVNINNIGWYLLEACYDVQNGIGKSWSYKHPNGNWEIEEPKQLLTDFFSKLFVKYKNKQIYVIGFSQGGMVCFDFILHLNFPLGGVFPICGFLRQPELDIPRLHSLQKTTPILIGHGRNDNIVPYTSSEKAYTELKKQGANVELLLYNGRHKIGIEYIKKMCEIIKR